MLIFYVFMIERLNNNINHDHSKLRWKKPANLFHKKVIIDPQMEPLKRIRCTGAAVQG